MCLNVIRKAKTEAPFSSFFFTFINILAISWKKQSTEANQQI